VPLRHAATDTSAMVEESRPVEGKEASVETTATTTTLNIGRIQPKLELHYTCGVCELRSTKQFSRVAYEKGVVIIRCGGCESLHLISDNLGWFGDEKNVEEIMRKRGEAVERGRRDADGNILLENNNNNSANTNDTITTDLEHDGTQTVVEESEDCILITPTSAVR
jgi:hypothetical protein